MNSPNAETTSTFPYKLYDMIKSACDAPTDMEGRAELVTWLPTGDGFLILDPQGFLEHLIPGYFNLTKMRSFTRQLNLYGFDKVLPDNKCVGWRHHNFLRDDPTKVKLIKRTAVKGFFKRHNKSSDVFDINFKGSPDDTKKVQSLPTPVKEKSADGLIRFDSGSSCGACDPVQAVAQPVTRRLTMELQDLSPSLPEQKQSLAFSVPPKPFDVHTQGCSDRLGYVGGFGYCVQSSESNKGVQKMPYGSFTRSILSAVQTHEVSQALLLEPSMNSQQDPKWRSTSSPDAFTGALGSRVNTSGMYPNESKYDIITRNFESDDTKSLPSSFVAETLGKKKGVKADTTSTFPYKLYDMIKSACDAPTDMEGQAELVTWLPTGDGFLILDPQGFLELIIPGYFNLTKMRSFTRQLNLYGFDKVWPDNKHVGWRHHNFLRDDPTKVKLIKRTAVKGIFKRNNSSDEGSPDDTKKALSLPTPVEAKSVDGLICGVCDLVQEVARPVNQKFSLEPQTPINGESKRGTIWNLNSVGTSTTSATAPTYVTSNYTAPNLTNGTFEDRFKENIDLGIGNDDYVAEQYISDDSDEDSMKCSPKEQNNTSKEAHSLIAEKNDVTDVSNIDFKAFMLKFFPPEAMDASYA